MIVKKNIQKVYFLFILSHILIWTLVPYITNKNLPLEKGLEHLCFEIHDQYKNNKVYGLSLTKNHFINPDKNEKHYFNCLTMLAGFRDE